MNARRVTPQEREKMWELYKKLGSYTKVAAKLNRSPATVSRHVHEYEAAVNAASVVLNAHTNNIEIQKGSVNNNDK